MGQAASFPFEALEPPNAYYATRTQAYWALFRGKRKADGAEVSVFKLDKVQTPKLKLEAGLHGFQRMKTVRHPYILQYLEGVDLEKEVILVTEPVVPLGEWLATLTPEFREQQVAWGLRCLAAALEFLNGSPQHLAHGMVCLQNVFVTKAGDWKLGGLDLLCEWRQGGKDIFHFQLHEALVPPQYRAPERRNNNMDLMLQGSPGALDMYALGVLLGEVVEATEGKAPAGALATIQRRLLSENPKDRASAGQVLRHSYFSPSGTKELIRVLEFLENFSLKDDSDKVQFFQNLGPVVARLPPEVGIYKILPTFRDYVHVGNGGLVAGGQTPDGVLMQQQARQRQLVLAALPVCLEILKGLDEAAFAEMGEPLMVSLFGMNDRAVRATLLQNLQPLASKLSEANLNGRLFDSLLTGFVDSAPQLRELTLKSMLCLSHRLNDKNLNDRLMYSLGKLQADPEPSIRTNTTIFLGRIAAQLKEGNRARILLPAFLKACRDPFPHARLAGLKAAAACTAYFDPPSVATKVLPIVATLLIDGDGQVREVAFQCHEAFMKVLQAHAQVLKEGEDQRRSEMAGKQGGGGGGGGGGLLPGGMDVLSGGAASLGGLTSSVAAWGAQKVWSSSTSLLGGSGSGAVHATGGVAPAAHDGGSLSSSTTSMGRSTSEGRKEEENFFDSMAPPSATKPGSRVASASADGWEEGGGSGGKQGAAGWGDDLDDDLDDPWEGSGGKSASFGSTKAAGTGGPALSVGGGVTGGLGVKGSLRSSASSAAAPPSSYLGALKLGGTPASKATTGGLVKPVTDDDLFSMLNETGPKPNAYSLQAAGSGLARPAPSLGASNTGSSSSSLSDSASKKAVTPVTGKGRLQAKKLEVPKDSMWDDF